MEFIDQMQRRVKLPQHPPRRIISLVPSQTELLADLGLDAEVLGITKFCVHPASWYREKTRIGGTKTLNLAKIAALQPDLIIGNKEENEQSQVEALMAQYPVWMSDISGLATALDMIRTIGAMTGKPEKADEMALLIQQRFDALLRPAEPCRAAYLIWRKPYLAAGSGTFIHEMLACAGFENVFAHKARYPETNLEELAAASPQAVLLSSEPFPFAEKHLAEIQSACPRTRVTLVDGELFSWYGSRLLQAPAYFQELLKKVQH